MLHFATTVMVLKFALFNVNSQLVISSVRYEKLADTRVVDTMEKIIPETTILDCVIYCAKNLRCKSINFAKRRENIGSCEISSVMRYSVEDKNTLEDEHYDHYYMDGPCVNNPCKYSGICTERESENGFTCDCPEPMGGETCSEVQCNGKICHQKERLVIYIYNGVSTTWSNSKTNCEKNNMTLLMIKDEETNDFVRGVLLKMYANLKPTLKHCFFIGLSRTNENDPLNWVDGSQLGDFQPWADDGPSGKCVVLCSTKE